VDKLKWPALFLFALAILILILVTFLKKYEFIINPQDKVFVKWGPPSTVRTADSAFDDVVNRRLGNSNLIGLSRKVTFTVKEVGKTYIVMDAKNEQQLKNCSDKAISEELEIGFPTGSPSPEVVVDGTVINPSVSPSHAETIRLYPIMVDRGDTRTITIIIHGIKRPLPYEAPDVVTRPTLHSELFFEGEQEILNGLEVDAVPLTWRDNWERVDPHYNDRTVYKWRTRYPIFPYQGASVIVRPKTK